MNGKRKFYILGSTWAKLQMHQLDAIELACLDTHFDPIELDAIKDVQDTLQQNPEAMLLLNPTALVELITLYSFIPNAQLVLLVFERDNAALQPYLHQLSGLRYLVGAQTPTMTRSVLGAIMEHHLTGEIRGLVPRLVSLEKQELLHCQLKNSSERSGLQQQVIEFFQQELQTRQSEMAMGIGSFPKYLGDVLDELLMNAVWDAREGRAKENRTISANLDADEEIFIDARCDSHNLTLSVTDNQGTFPVEAFLKPLKFALGFKDDASINESAGGAGIGLYMILQKVTAISFEIDRGKLTRVTGVLRGDQSLRDTQRKPRTLLLFEKKPPRVYQEP